MTPPSKRKVKVKIGGAVVSIPGKAIPKKVGRPRRYPEHAPTNRPNTLPPDPWEIKKINGRKQDDLTTKVGKHRFYKEELSEKYVEAKMAEYRAGGVPKLITYHDPEEETDAYASLMQQPTGNRPTLRSIRQVQDLGFRTNNASRRPIWDSQTKTSIWLWDHNNRNEGAPFNYREENSSGNRSPRKRSSGSSSRNSARKVSRQGSSRTKPRTRKGP